MEWGSRERIQCNQRSYNPTATAEVLRTPLKTLLGSVKLQRLEKTLLQLGQPVGYTSCSLTNTERNYAQKLISPNFLRSRKVQSIHKWFRSIRRMVKNHRKWSTKSKERKKSQPSKQVLTLGQLCSLWRVNKMHVIETFMHFHLRPNSHNVSVARSWTECQ